MPGGSDSSDSADSGRGLRTVSAARSADVLRDPDDTPFPSRLVLGWRGSKPLQVVVADDAAMNETIVIAVYEPDSDQWEPGFRRRRQR